MSSSNNRMAYNTIILYVKLLLSIVIGLYSSRLVLQALGYNDFGLYSVIGGIVALLNVMGVSMVSTSYRFIAVEIGKGVNGSPNRVYNTVLVIHIIIAVLFVTLGLLIGLLYVDNWLNVEYSKLSDAKYVLIISIITAAISLLSIPSSGLIIAREKFVFISCVEISQLLIKMLLIILVLQPYLGNKLRLYTNLTALVTLIAPIAYTIYCRIVETDISKWKLNTIIHDYRVICSFTGWMLISSLSFMGVNQGGAMILNKFFGTIVNAGFGIALQVQNYLLMFPKNIIQAISPQIMKSYGGNNEERALTLVYRSTKYCFYIFLIIAVPFLLCMDKILIIWLGEIPPYAAIFTSFLIISSVIGSLTNGFDAFVLATGKVKLMQIGYVITNFIQLPIMYFMYSMGGTPYVNVIIMVFMTCVSVLYQIFVISKVSNFSVYEYFKVTLVPILKVLIFVVPLFLIRVKNNDISFIQLVIHCLIVLVVLGIVILSFGMDKTERKFIKQLILKK